MAHRQGAQLEKEAEDIHQLWSPATNLQFHKIVCAFPLSQNVLVIEVSVRTLLF